MVQSRCHTSFFPHGGFRLRDDTIPQTVLFPDLFTKPLIATFDQPHASSDGGGILLKAAERRYGLVDGFARCLVDDRAPGKVRHTLRDLLAQRIFGLACGHPDANDADRLADDPIHKLLLGRDPIVGDPLAFLTFNDESEQYLCAAMLRPGNAPATAGAVALLRRLLDLLRLAFPKARFLVRLDGGYATPEVLDFLDAEPRLDYVVAMAENAVLTRHAESAMVEARTLSDTSGQTEHLYTETRYAARTWPRERRVVIKAEVVRLPGREPRDNPRFVITNLRQSPRFVYEHVYCARGDIENRIKELHEGLEIGRTSCCRFWANQLRVLLTAAAYVLMQELRLRAAHTACARAQVTGLRERLLKLGVHVVVSVRRIVLHLPTSTPDLDAWRHIALALGARPS